MWEIPTFECGDPFDALDARLDEDGLGWYELADGLGGTPSRLTSLRTARLA